MMSMERVLSAHLMSVCARMCVWLAQGQKGVVVLRDPQAGIYLSLCTHTQTHTITDSAQD